MQHGKEPESHRVLGGPSEWGRALGAGVSVCVWGRAASVRASCEGRPGHRQRQPGGVSAGVPASTLELGIIIPGARVPEGSAHMVQVRRSAEPETLRVSTATEMRGGRDKIAG